MRFSFVKMHGAGNDFVMIDNREGSFPAEAHVIAGIAPRGVGIGCEGVILLQKSERADFGMRFFNPDGTEADMCGNGARCVAAFARDYLPHRLAALRTIRRTRRSHLCIARFEPRLAHAFGETALLAKCIRNALHLPMQQPTRLINRNQNRIRRDNGAVCADDFSHA